MGKDYTPMLTIFRRKEIIERPIYGPRRQLVRPWGKKAGDGKRRFCGVASSNEGAKPYKGKPVFICYDEGASYHVEQEGFIIAWFHATSLTGDGCSAVRVWNALVKMEEEAEEARKEAKSDGKRTVNVPKNR